VIQGPRFSALGSSNSVDPRILPLATFSNRRFGWGVAEGQEELQELRERRHGAEAQELR